MLFRVHFPYWHKCTMPFELRLHIKMTNFPNHTLSLSHPLDRKEKIIKTHYWNNNRTFHLYKEKNQCTKTREKWKTLKNRLKKLVLKCSTNKLVSAEMSTGH